MIGLGLKRKARVHNFVSSMEWFQPVKTTASQENIEQIAQREQHDGTPGTTNILDLQHKREDVKHRGNGIVLVPQPSSDPDDPLNWTKFRKIFFISQAIFITFLICCLTSVFGVLVEGFQKMHVNVTIVTRGTSVSFLLFGWLNVLFQPLSMSYGRRFLVLMVSFGCGVGAVMWNAYTYTNGSYYGARALQGILGAPVESLIELLVADVFFEHERAFWMSLYGFALNGGTFFGPLAAAWVAQNMSLQWVFYFVAIFSGAAGVFLFFFFEESGYVRKLPVLSGATPQKEPADLPNISQVMEQEKTVRPPPNQYEEESPTYDKEVESQSDVYKRKPYWQKIKLFSRLRKFPTLWQFLRPLVVLYKLPHIQWAGWMVASSLCGFQVLTGTISTTFSEPPYNFSEGMVGLTYIGGAVGIIIGCLVAGPLNDWLCLYIAGKRGGVHEAEDRIYGVLPLIVMFPAAYILYGVGAAKGIHWIGPVFGLGMLGFCMALSSVVPYTYAIDAAGGIGSDCIVAVVLMRNTISFAVSFGITAWISGMGMQNAFISVAFIFGFAFWITSIPMLLWGKNSRARSAETYYNWIAEDELE